jgi:hypothetical protein
VSTVYVFAILRTSQKPISGAELHQATGAYTFYPSNHEGEVLTIDEMLWKSQRNLTSSTDVRLTLWPSTEDVEQSSAEPLLAKQVTLIATTEARTANALDGEKIIELAALQSHAVNEFHFAGFDVIDTTGLSGLTNVGYSQDDLKKLSGGTIGTTEYGLIARLEDAQRFALFASSTAREHAPFSPVSIFFRRHLAAAKKSTT